MDTTDRLEKGLVSWVGWGGRFLRILIFELGFHEVFS